MSAQLPGRVGPGDEGERPTLSVVNAMFAWVGEESHSLCTLKRLKRLNVGDADVIPARRSTEYIHPSNRLYTSDS